MSNTIKRKIIERELLNGKTVYDVRYREDSKGKTKTFYSLEEAEKFNKEIYKKKLSKIKSKFLYPDNFFKALFEKTFFNRSSDKYVYEHFDENYMALRIGKIPTYITEKEFFILDTTLKEGHTLEYTGHILGITRERVRVIQEKALIKLKRYIKVFEIGYNNFILENDIEKLEEELKKKKIELMLQIENLAIAEEDKKEFDSFKKIPVNSMELNFSSRTINVLRRAGIKTLDAITEYTVEEIIRLRSLGVKSFKEIEKALKKYNLKFKTDY